MTPLFRMPRLVSLVAVLTLSGGGAPAFLAAQTPAALEGATVEVRQVKFTSLRAPGSEDSWLEAAVEVTVTANPAGGGAARFADRVQVTLNLSLGTQDQGFFRSTAEAVSLSTGRATFRFYLPPEVVRRYQVNRDPYAYAVELAVQSRPVPMSTGAASSVIRSAEDLRALKDRVAQAARLNDGVLVPQYLSPFATTYAGDTPSFVRRER